MLAVEIEFLTGRYVASSYNDRRRGEWPPHPARLFSALVATCMEAAAPDPEERDALRWLERQGAPELSASEASVRELVTVFVPVNDTTVLGDVAELAKELESAEAARTEAEAVQGSATEAKPHATAARALVRAEQAVEKHRDRLARALSPGKASAQDLRSAHRLLPEHRGRQPRAFPSVTPESPIVHFSWPQAETPPREYEALDRLTRRLVRLGHSSSLVRCRLVSAPRPSTWFPDEDGAEVLRVPEDGQLARLDDDFARNVTEGRVLPCAFQRYRKGVRRVPALARTRSAFGDDWIVLRRVGDLVLPSIRAVDVAVAVRGAMLTHADQPAREILTGHASDGSPTERPHVAYVPIPFVGSEHADGRILGVAIVMPRDIGESDRHHVVRALGRWEKSQRQDGEEAPALSLTLGAAGVLRVERVVSGATPGHNLRPSTWCSASRTWVSATPLALDRHPGRVQSRDPDPAKRALAEAKSAAEAKASVALACERIGLPAPESVTILPSVSLVGTSKARQFPPFPPREGVRRAKVHVVVRFFEPVAGPLLLGAGRYVGLGLLRPVGDDDVPAAP